MRQCPTLSGDELPLIAHSIENEVCAQRQREFYHKCHRCLFRGKPIDFVLPRVDRTRSETGPVPQENAPTRNGSVRPLEVELLRSESPAPVAGTPAGGSKVR